MGCHTGKRRWELTGSVPLDGAWEAHRALLDAHQPFRNFEYMRKLGEDLPHDLSVSGIPVFDDQNRFLGFRVAIARNNCKRLIRLINDILDIEKIESGKMRLDLQVVDLQPLLAQVLAANEGFGAAQNVSLRLNSPEGDLRVDVDSDRLAQVVTNLLSNVVKFSPSRGGGGGPCQTRRPRRAGESACLLA